jgi:hypothetical protein
MYAPLPTFWSSISVDKIPQSAHRTQLSSARLPQDKSEFACSDLLSLIDNDRPQGYLMHKIDQGHVVGFWAMAASARTHMVNRKDVERFQQGEWEGPIAQRRLGREDVLPLWRGGPVWVEGHSWAVRQLLGVRVYEKKE